MSVCISPQVAFAWCPDPAQLMGCSKLVCRQSRSGTIKRYRLAGQKGAGWPTPTPRPFTRKHWKLSCGHKPLSIEIMMQQRVCTYVPAAGVVRSEAPILAQWSETRTTKKEPTPLTPSSWVGSSHFDSTTDCTTRVICCSDQPTKQPVTQVTQFSRGSSGSSSSEP